MARERRIEIDILKGLAILCVILNHSGAANGTIFYKYFITRAVPIFLVLLGLNGELWWTARACRRMGDLLSVWFVSRFKRLLVPYWGALTLWWGFIALVAGGVPLLPGFVAMSYLGYAPWITTYWFVTVALEYVVVFPLLRWIVSHTGVLGAALLALSATVVSALHALDIIRYAQEIFGALSPYPPTYFWVFGPTYLWHVVGGMLLARHPKLSNPRATLLAVPLYLALALGRALWDGGTVSLAFELVSDVPFTIILLALLRTVPVVLPLLVEPLRLLGASSLGLYLGHVVVHEVVHRLGAYPDWGDWLVRWGYFFQLLIGGLLLTRVGTRFRSVLSNRTPL